MTDSQVAGYLTSEEAAQALGIKRATLYTYVSRGMVRIAPTRDGKRRLYLASDVAALRTRADSHKGHAAAAASSMGWGPPILESSITSIGHRGPGYRGHAAIDLIGDASFEDAADLLWTGDLTDQAPGLEAKDMGVPVDGLEALVPEGTPPFDVLAVLVPALAAADPMRHAATEAAELASAGRLIRRLTAGLALTGDRGPHRERMAAALRAPSIAAALCCALGVSAAHTVAVDRALVLCADHELNASTFAARVVASTGAGMHACVAAALAALSGPRHGGLTERVEVLLDEVGSFAQVGRALGARFSRGASVHGFGHPLYPDGDPRGRALLDALSVEASLPPRVLMLLEIVRCMHEAGHPPPILDIGLVATASAVGLPRGGAAALFAVGRCAGWVAHAREQAATGTLLRPRARYTGP